MKLDELVTPQKKLIVPASKPRNPTYRDLAAKKNAAGAHKDKKDALKRGDFKHKGQMCEADNIALGS